MSNVEEKTIRAVPTCPQLMTDGRVLSNYHPESYVVREIQSQNGIKNSYDLRQYMIHNALNLMRKNREQYQKMYAGCQIQNPDAFGHDRHWEQRQRELKYRKY
ncbi:MAG: hypothetical protein ACYCOU_16500 [Sulfobacillus sp.]